MANTGFNLNRGIIRNFNYTNLLPTNVQTVPSTTGIITVQNNASNIIQKFGVDNIARIQNMRGPSTYSNSDLGVITVNGEATINVENLNNVNNNLISGNITSGFSNVSDSTNFFTLTAS